MNRISKKQITNCLTSEANLANYNKKTHLYQINFTIKVNKSTNCNLVFKTSRVN